MSEVFKIQRPLAGDLSLALVYNRSRSVYFSVPIETVLGLFEEGDLKVYYLGKVTAGGLFETLRRVPDPGW